MGEKYKITGLLTNGKRFKTIHTSNFYYADSINLYHGHVWMKQQGHWKIIKSV